MEKGILEFDGHSFMRPCQGALDRIALYFHERELFQEDKKQQEQALYDLVGARVEDVFAFTSSASESVAQVIWSVFFEVCRKHGKTNFITSCVEDAPTLQMLKRCEHLGCTVKIAPVDAQGRVDVAKLASLITPRTALISMTMAQGLTGVIQPFEEIGQLAKERGVLLHLDGSYALGKIVFSFSDLNVDYLTFSGERIHSVQGSGGVFAKKNSPLIPFIPAGHFDFPSFAALGAAASLARLSLDAMGLETARLRALFEEKIVQLVPDALILFKETFRLPNTTAIVFPRVHAEALFYYLTRKGLYPNSSGSYAPHLHSVLASSGIDGISAMSFSLSRMTSEQDVVRAVSLIEGTVKSLRGLTEDL